MGFLDVGGRIVAFGGIFLLSFSGGRMALVAHPRGFVCLIFRLSYLGIFLCLVCVYHFTASWGKGKGAPAAYPWRNFP